ncbi:phosphoribosylglycinamide formyltransferase [Legionella bononiensis]|uniref:Phosphoribosylglycinamide formyltransferase n=1 Tax=Legionella bononiensis TaxID=2793102 RepID=A0ABS1WCF2_9GAMM|nr:phosphoribosylglycinamide formyltransferase [Legionella bononiensis]MBL7478907.1 phosphoribosylglycinamide formyltransferase [Legionella bononiensis]MBL7527039.1 phosphoribosylglycinamide formyltransferase [Legionella bononiensis]MBL7562008.1 phosphoribosylglycinamide formyltransferase [Legionella bononiensis]
MTRLGILGSTRGTNLLPIIDAINQHKLLATIEVVISNKSNAIILERAKQYGLHTEYLGHEGLNRAQYDMQISRILQQHKVDLVVLIGYMRILSEEFVALWNNKVINVHPSLLPDFAGKMDLEVHQAVIQAGARETGCTIHYVTKDVDEGPIVLQKKCPVLEDDTPESLKERVQLLEGIALVEAIQKIASQ